MSLPLQVRRLGIQPYESIWQRMSIFTDKRQENDFDELWMMQHRPVFTQGQAGKPEHILAPGAIPVVHSDRGGQATYHGPGQLVAYPLINLRRRKLSVRGMVSLLEQTVIDLLTNYGVSAYAKADAPGVYVQQVGGEAKIASLGLRVRKGCSFHGISINVDMDLSPFQQINPCGYEGLVMTQLRDLAKVKMVNYDDVERAIIGLIADKLDASVIDG